MEEQFLEMKKQLKESSKRPEGVSPGDGALGSVVDPGSAQSVQRFDVLHCALIPSAGGGDEALGCHFGSLQTLPLDAYLATELAYNPVDPLIGFEFLAP